MKKHPLYFPINSKFLNILVIYFILINALLTTFSVLCINIVYEKRNLQVGKNQSYMYQVSLTKQNADLIPSSVSMQYDIYNFNGTTNNYFDFFYYVSDTDIACYNAAIGNESYLFPCPFISNNYAKIRINKVVSLNQMPQIQVNKLQDVSYTFIVDNTPFPFPSGSYPYTDIFLNIKTNLSITISSKYQQLAMRLIAINTTVLLIFLFFIGCLVLKERKIKLLMEVQKIQNNKESLLKPDKKHISSRSSEGDDENYTDFLGRTVVEPQSMLDSKDRSLCFQQS